MSTLYDKLQSLEFVVNAATDANENAKEAEANRGISNKDLLIK